MKVLKCISLTVLVLFILVLSAFSMTSLASDTDSSAVVSEELTLPDGQDYQFYAQTRTNRLNTAKTDVRIICVATQDWIWEIPNFVASFTFTDGTTLESWTSDHDIPKMHAMEDIDFVRCLETGEKNRNYIDNILESAKLLDYLYQSAEQHREISF